MRQLFTHGCDGRAVSLLQQSCDGADPRQRVHFKRLLESVFGYLVEH